MGKGPFKMKGMDFGISPIKQTKFQIKRAKRLVRKNVANVVHESEGGTTDLSERKRRRSEKKINKAIEILRNKGYSEGDIETMTGAHGIEPAMDWAKKKK